MAASPESAHISADREFDRVANQVEQHLPEAYRIAENPAAAALDTTSQHSRIRPAHRAGAGLRAYAVGLPAQVFRALRADGDEAAEPPLCLALLGPCVREGFDLSDKIVLRQVRRGRMSRRAVHREFAQIAPFLSHSPDDEAFPAALDPVREAVEINELLG